jgi:cellulose synthase/poly-beta-1,6-N-acetylglucosamine synthase-like glycosyltransferase
MFTLPLAILYVTLFVSLFFEVFLLITYFETREILKEEKKLLKKPITHFPSVSIIVPSFNEEKTVAGTVNSLLALDYPKDKLKLILIDDGSTDRTLDVMNGYLGNPQIRIFTKPNEGSKYAALNYALTKIDTDLVGCLDADSFVSSDALKLMIPFFQDEKTMAVTPSIKIYNPKKVLQYIQKMEYTWGVFFRRMLSTMGALYVTPGPFSIFRKEVFEKLGGYKEAHHTEDMELALRMQRNGYKIVNSVGAHVFTVAPDKIRALYKQRVRWTYGFLNNAYDYRDMYFKPKYGNIATFILPIATISIFTTLYAAATFIYGAFIQLLGAISKYQAIGFTPPSLPTIKFDWFFINTSVLIVVGALTLAMNITLLLLSTKMAGEKKMFGRELFLYIGLYLFIVPFWLAKATFNTVFSKKITWR